MGLSTRFKSREHMPACHRVIGDHAREEDVRDILLVVVHDVLDDDIQRAARGRLELRTVWNTYVDRGQRHI